MQDTGPAPLPPRTVLQGPPGPELPLGLMKVIVETVPILFN